MHDAVQCARLSERDYFDVDYDLHYDAAMTHFCRHFAKRIIPAQSCSTRCPGYVTSPTGQAPRANKQHRDLAAEPSGVTKAEAQRRMFSVVDQIRVLINQVPTDEDIEVQRDRLQRGRDELRRVESEITSLTEEAASLTKRIAEAKQTLIKTDVLAYLRWHIQGGRPPAGQPRSDCARIESIVHIKRKLNERRDSIVVENRRIEQALRPLLQDEARRGALVTLSSITRRRGSGALENCRDMLSNAEWQGFQRFLEEARRGLVPGVSVAELERLVDLLSRMRI